MPVSSETSISGPYYPNGSTKSFAFDFKATAANEVVAVDQNGSSISQALYSVTLDDDEGGTLTFSTAPELSDYSEIYVVGNPALTQPSDFDNAGPSFNPAAMTRAFDRAAARDLRQQREIDRGLKFAFGENGFTLPPPSARLNKFFGFGVSGLALMSSGTGADAGLRDDLADPDIGSRLMAFSHEALPEPGSVGEKLQRFIMLTDAPYNGKCDAGGTFGAITGTDDSDAWDAAIAAIKAAGGGKLWVPGKSRCDRSIVIDFDGLTIVGDGGHCSQMWVNHDGIAIDYTAGTNNLPDGKFHTHGFGIIQMFNDARDGNGFPTAGAKGTALKLTNAYGSTFFDLYIENFDRSIHLHDSAILSFVGFTDRNCWTGRYFSGYTNTIEFHGGVINNSSIDSYRDEVKSIAFHGVDIEAASKTCQIGTANHFKGGRLERLHIDRPAWFKWFQINGDDNEFDFASRFFWDGSALPGPGVHDFFIEVAGKNNRLHFNYVFNHEKVVKLTAASANNDVFWSARFLDYEHSGNNNNYRFSNRFYVDAGSGNRMHYVSSLARVESNGSAALRCEGKLNAYLRNSALGFMTITAASLTIAACDVAGPLGVPATDENVRKVTLAAGATKRATIDPAIVADGNTVYSLVAYIRMPSGGTQVTRVRLGIGDGNFTDIYPADGTDIWHRVVLFHKPPNGTAVKYMIEAEGDIGDVFQIGFPSLAAGECPAFIDRTHAAVTNTQTAATSFDSDSLRYAGRPERGTFTPGLNFGGVAQGGLVVNGGYTRIGDMIDVQGSIALTGAPGSSGAAVITGLPYDVSADGNFGSVPITLVPVNMTFSGQISGMTTPGSKTAELYQTTEAGARSGLTHANFASNSYFYFHARYSV